MFEKSNFALTKEKSSQEDLFTLRNNPWKLFSKYNNSLDNNLATLLSLKRQYLELENSYKTDLQMISELQQMLDKKFSFFSMLKNHSDNTFLSSIIAAATAHLLLIFLVRNFSISLGVTSISLFTFSFFSISFIVGSYFSHKKMNQNIQSKISQLKTKMTIKEEEFRSMEKTYKKKAKAILNNGSVLNIREHLDYYYHSDIHELNIIVQELLEKSFPTNNMLKITPNIQDDLEKLKNISGTKHIYSISKYLKNMFNEKISSSITNQIFKSTAKENFIAHIDSSIIGPSILNIKENTSGIKVSRLSKHTQEWEEVLN